MTSKKAQAKTILPALFDIVISVMVFFSIMFAVHKINTNEAYDEQVFITHLGLGMQKMQAMGNDINLERDIADAGGYNLVFEGTQVYIKERGAQGTTFLFTHSPDMRFIGGEFSPEKGKETIGPIKLFKRGRLYGATKPENVPSPHLLNCDTNPGKKLKKILLSPDTRTDEAFAYTVKMINLLKAGRPRFIEISDNTETASIILHLGKKETDQDYAKAYYDGTPESKNLACEILNSITQKFKIPVRLVPVNPEYHLLEDPKNSLNRIKPSVLLELGNQQKKDSILAEDKQLAIQIYKGIENYGIE
jgi:hypothetical protein